MAELALHAKEDYSYIESMADAPFDVVGQGIGPDGDYGHLRGEDFAFLLELLNERQVVYNILVQGLTIKRHTIYDILEWLYPRSGRWRNEMAGTVTATTYGLPRWSWPTRTARHLITSGVATTNTALANEDFSKLYTDGTPHQKISLDYSSNLSQYKYPRMDFITGLYNDMLYNNGIHFAKQPVAISQKYYKVTTRLDTRREWSGADDYRDNPDKQPTTTPYNSQSTHVGLNTLCEAYYGWNKRRCCYKGSDSIYRDYTNYTINRRDTAFEPLSKTDIAVEFPAALDTSIYQLYGFAKMQFDRSSYVKYGSTTVKNESQTAYAIVPIKCVKDDTSTAKQRWILKFEFDVKNWTEYFKTMAENICGMDTSLESAAKPYFDHEVEMPTEGNSILNSGSETFKGRILWVDFYAVMNWNTNLQKDLIR